jgi:ABC-type branched-subunit amino acid transport system substrate-binding protein
LYLASAVADVDQLVIIGGIATLTGEGAPYGINAQRGALLAIEDINGRAESKLSLNVIWEDESGGRAERAVAAYRKLTAIDRADVIFGPTYLDGLLAVAPLAKRDGKLLVTGSNPALSLPNVFATWIDPRQEAEAMARRMFANHRRAAVLGCQQAYDALIGRSFRESFSGLGGEVLFFTQPLPDAIDLKTEVLKAKQAKPDAVFIATYTLFSKYARELKRANLQAPIYAIEVDQSVIDAAAGARYGGGRPLCGTV